MPGPLTLSSPVAGTIHPKPLRQPSPALPVSDPVLAVHASALLSIAQGLKSLAAGLEALAQENRNSGCAETPDLPAGPMIACPTGPVSPPVFDPDVPYLSRTINQFILAKAKQGRSMRYLATLRVTLKSFAEGRHGQALASITTQEVEAWLNRKGWAARTRRGYALDLMTMLNWAVRRGLIAKNPIAGLELPTVPMERAPGIHTPEQVKRALAAAYAHDLGLGRDLAIRYFAGLRSCEALRIQESNILPAYVEIPAGASKTRQRRLVRIRPALAAFLALGGKVPLDNSNVMRARLPRLTGFDWPHNVARHSFCSYALADSESAAKTALEAGHSESMLFRHYREVVTHEAANEFWAIRP